MFYENLLLFIFSGFLGVISISATEVITLAHQNGMPPSFPADVS